MAKLSEDFPHVQLLTDAGFGTEAKVRNASDEELLAIKHIGTSALEEIRAASRQVEPKADEPENAPPEAVAEEPEPEVVVSWECPGQFCGHTITSSPCPYCGHA